jgi:predicted Zn-dependent peptidase
MPVRTPLPAPCTRLVSRIRLGRPALSVGRLSRALSLLWLLSVSATPGFAQSATQSPAPAPAPTATPSPTPPPSPTDGAELPVVFHTLENGMRFLILPRQTTPTVSFVVYVPVGSVNEALGTTGAAHILEHLLFKGSTTVGTSDLEAERALFAQMDAVHDDLLQERGRGPRADTTRMLALEDEIRALEDAARAFVIPGEFDDILSRNGARSLNASTSWESTIYHVELPANRAELWFALEADRMRNPVFREFHRERDVVEEERRARLETDPGGQLLEAHVGAAFRIHPYGVLPIGHMEDIRNVTRRAIEDFHARHYGPENTVVAMVGAIDPDSARVWAEAYFAPLTRRGPAPPVLAIEPPQRGERRLEVLADAEPQIRIGWKVGDETHPDAAALGMLANLLVGGRDARLQQRLVRDDRTASFVTAGTLPGGRFPGLFTIHAAPRAPYSTKEVEVAIYEELERLVREPPTEFDLDRIRNRLEASRVRRLVSNLGLAMQLAESEAVFGDWRTTFGLQARMQAVTPDDIVRVIEQWLIPETRTVAILRRPTPAVEGDR